MSIVSPGCAATARNIFDDPGGHRRARLHALGRKLPELVLQRRREHVRRRRSSRPTTATSRAASAAAPTAQYRRSRVTAAKNILSEVICQVNAAGEVRFGLAQFRRPGADQRSERRLRGGADQRLPDPAGTPNVYTLNGVSQQPRRAPRRRDRRPDGESWTPLGETLFQVYTYFMSRDSAQRPARPERARRTSPPTVPAARPTATAAPQHARALRPCPAARCSARARRTSSS